jgi:hypothetical protein
MPQKPHMTDRSAYKLLIIEALPRRLPEPPHDPSMPIGWASRLCLRSVRPFTGKLPRVDVRSVGRAASGRTRVMTKQALAGTR